MLKKIFDLFPFVFVLFSCVVFCAEFSPDFEINAPADNICDTVVEINDVIIEKYIEFTDGNGKLIKVPFYDKISSIPQNADLKYLENIFSDLSHIKALSVNYSQSPSISLLKFKYNTGFSMVTMSYISSLQGNIATCKIIDLYKQITAMTKPCFY